MNWISRIQNKVNNTLEQPVEKNPVDRVIVEKGEHPEINKIYEARWVWYHTILAIEIFCTNILLLGILIILAVK